MTRHHPTYWRDGVAHLEAHDATVAMPTLFDLLDHEKGEAA